MRVLFRRFAPYLLPHRRALALATVSTLGVTVAELAKPWPLKIVLDLLVGRDRAGARGAFEALFRDMPENAVLVSVAAALVLVALLGGALGYLRTDLLSRVSQRVVNAIRVDLFEHLSRLSLAFHRRSRTGDLLVRLTGDVNVLNDVLVQTSVVVGGQILLLAGMIALLLWMDARLTLLALSILPFLGVLVTRYAHRIRRAARNQRKREGRIAASAGETIAAIPIVQAFTREDLEATRFRAESESSLREGVRATRYEAAMQRTVEVVTACGTALVLWYGVRRVHAGALTPGDLVVFVSYLKNLYRPLRDLANFTNRAAKAAVCAERIFEVLETVPDVREIATARPAPRFAGRVAFERVTFAYEGRRPVLEAVSFHVEPGALVAVVGPTGSGKSTLMSLLPRFADPTAGRVLVDGMDIRDFTLASLRAQVSIVLQEPMLFGVSIRENIAYGKAGATEAEIRAAAGMAHAAEFIERLPDRYDTVIAERGATLSGGQKQRIAIARALLRDAPILILDEPTTGLDAFAEAEVLGALSTLIQGRTTFVIAHRYESIREADLIVLLAEGRVQGLGTHEELFASSRLYRAQVERQAQGSRIHSLARRL